MQIFFILYKNNSFLSIYFVNFSKVYKTIYSFHNNIYNKARTRLCAGCLYFSYIFG